MRDATESSTAPRHKSATCMYTYGNNEPDSRYSVFHGGRHGIIHCAPVTAGLPARLPVRTVHGTVKMSQPTAKNTSTLARVCGFQLPTFNVHVHVHVCMELGFCFISNSGILFPASPEHQPHLFLDYLVLCHEASAMQ